MKPEHLDANRRHWDERVSLHAASDFYDVKGFLDGESTLRDFETEELGPVSGRSLLHLQCHFGLDSLSWARRGARVTGLDFSRTAIRAAEDLARRSGLDSSFVHGDVLNAARILGRRFDVVYTGLGAICWIDDLERWASQINALLHPGGTFYLVEFHPFTDVFGERDLTVEASYFNGGTPLRVEETGTYADPAAETTENLSFTWTHPVSTVINRLVESGLRLDRFEEHDYTIFPRFESLTPDPGTDVHRFPVGHPKLPLMYSLRMHRDRE
ncbi:MAG: SAM-dependent methyltransferase [Phycisphaerae bacterium]|nr:SAM-dependent methyltransferase [Phycisphaerae bacterium]